MEIMEKVAYLKGLAEGLGLDADSKEGKLINVIIDILDDMALEMEELRDNMDELCDEVDEMNDELGDLEEIVYDEEEDEDEDEAYFETTCPVCEEEIVFDDSILESGCVKCPNCGEKLEFDLSALESDCCCGCDCDCEE